MTRNRTKTMRDPEQARERASKKFLWLEAIADVLASKRRTKAKGGLTDLDLSTAVVATRTVDHDLVFYMSAKELMKRTGASKSAAESSLMRLRHAGFLELCDEPKLTQQREERENGGRLANTYRMTVPDANRHQDGIDAAPISPVQPGKSSARVSPVQKGETKSASPAQPGKVSPAQRGSNSVEATVDGRRAPRAPASSTVARVSTIVVIDDDDAATETDTVIRAHEAPDDGIASGPSSQTTAAEDHYPPEVSMDERPFAPLVDDLPEPEPERWSASHADLVGMGYCLSDADHGDHNAVDHDADDDAAFRADLHAGYAQGDSAARHRVAERVALTMVSVEKPYAGEVWREIGADARAVFRAATRDADRAAELFDNFTDDVRMAGEKITARRRAAQKSTTTASEEAVDAER